MPLREQVELPALVLTIAVGTLLPAIAAGDVIYLKNGNTLQGEVEITNEQEVTVNIPGAGRLTLNKDEIASIETTAQSSKETSWATLRAKAVRLHKQGQHVAAIPLAEEALKLAEATFGPDDLHVATSSNDLALLYQTQGRYADAEALHKRVLAIDEKVLGKDHPDVAASLMNLAFLYKSQGQYAQAESLYKQALASLEKALGPDNEHVATVLDNLGSLYRSQGKYAEAEPLQKRAIAIYEKTLGPDNVHVGVALNNLAILYQGQGQYAQAEPLHQRALAILQKALGPDHPEIAMTRRDYAVCLRKLGKIQEAKLLEVQAEGARAEAVATTDPGIRNVPSSILSVVAPPASSYIRSVITSLALVEAARVEMGKVNTEAMKNPSSAEHQAAMFRQAAAQCRVARDKVGEAIGILEPYRGSDLPRIEQSNDALLHAYDGLRQFNQDTALLFDEMAQGQEDGTAEAQIPAWMKRQLEINERSSQVWDPILEVVSQKVGLAMIEVPKEGQPGRLAMTASERDRLIAEIDRLVPKAKQGLQAGQSHVIFGVGIIRQVLLQVPTRD